MRVPRNLDAKDLINALEKHWGYRVVRQVGSHIRLETNEPTNHPITIPAHKPLKIGTLNSILRSIAEHKQTTREEILKSV